MEEIEKAIEMLRQQVLADEAKTREIHHLAELEQKRLRIENRRNANLELLLERYAHQGERLEFLIKTAPELIDTILAIREWQELIGEKLEVIERKLDMALELQRFLLAHLPDSAQKTRLEQDLNKTWVLDQREALKQRLIIQQKTLNKLLEREAKLGLDSPVGLETAIEEAKQKIIDLESEIAKLI